MELWKQRWDNFRENDLAESMLKLTINNIKFTVIFNIRHNDAFYQFIPSSTKDADWAEKNKKQTIQIIHQLLTSKLNIKPIYEDKHAAAGFVFVIPIIDIESLMIRLVE